MDRFLNSVAIFFEWKKQIDQRNSHFDTALMVDAYHKFPHPAEMLPRLHRALKTNGRINLLESRGEDPRIAINALHKMAEEQSPF
jgi:ubiquinone/menaquinone biosynthesis C-methylase UbiE